MVLLGSGIVLYRWWHNRPPFGPGDLHVSVSLQVAEPTGAQRMHTLGVGGIELVANAGDQIVRGQVRWQLPRPGANGRFAIVLIDKRTQRQPPNIFGAAANGRGVYSGGDGVLNQVAARYSWLRGAADIQDGPGSWKSAGMSLWTSPYATDVAFLAHFPAKDDRYRTEQSYFATAPVGRDDLLLALVFIGPDRQVYWAERVYG